MSSLEITPRPQPAAFQPPELVARLGGALMRITPLALVLLPLAVGPSDAWAKDRGPCAGVQVEKDAFGVESKGAAVYVGIGGYLAVLVQQVGTDKHLQMMFVQRGVVDTKVPAGTPGKVAMADGTVLEMSASKDAVPVANANDSTAFTQWIVEFPLSAEDLGKLAASPITAVSSEIAGQQMQFAVPDTKAPKLQAAAACISAG